MHSLCSALEDIIVEEIRTEPPVLPPNRDVTPSGSHDSLGDFAQAHTYFSSAVAILVSVRLWRFEFLTDFLYRIVRYGSG